MFMKMSGLENNATGFTFFKSSFEIHLDGKVKSTDCYQKRWLKTAILISSVGTLIDCPIEFERKASLVECSSVRDQMKLSAKPRNTRT
jgi:hypothetical protein